MVKQSMSSLMLGLSNMTWNAFKPHSACLEAARQFCLRKKFEGSLCLGITCGKGVPRRKEMPLVRRHARAFPSKWHPNFSQAGPNSADKALPARLEP